MNEELVSIIIPVYNAESFLEDTIKTIQNQTYTNWEAIFVDDVSTDESVSIIKKHMSDKQIKLYQLQEKGMAAGARNRGIDEATGRFICFLDADDLWDKHKLAKQIKFMNEKQCAFSFTGYEFADRNGIPNGKKVYIPKTINYKQALKNTTIWTSTVMFDLLKISKEDFHMPNVKSEDTATWWSVLKKVEHACGLNEILSFYRRSEGTLSSNKKEAIKRTWFLYRNVEKLNLFYSIYCFIGYATNAIKRRI